MAVDAEGRVIKNPTEAKMKARAAALVPQLRELAAEADRLRRLPEKAIELIRAQDLLRTILSPSCGGFGLSMRAHLDVVSTLAEGCGATAWVVGVGHAHSWLLGHFSRAAQTEVYGRDPNTLVSAVIAPRGKATRQTDGSLILNGRWPFASGCEHAEWLLLGAEILDGAGAAIDEADLLVPTKDVTILDDWYVAGLQGTGSATVVAKNVAVPAHRALSLPGLIEGKAPGYDAPDSDWLLRAQAVPVLGLCICGAALGLARAARREFTRIVKGKAIAYTNHIADDWIPTQTTLGHAAAMINAAELVLYRVADDIDHYARLGHQMAPEMRARIRMDCSYGVRLSMEAVDRLFIGGGASVLSLNNSLQRASRDLHAINMHALLVIDASAEIYGRVLLGKNSNSPIY
jgi:3-hydroxy-9,10-secoandrosta-1,3,5(10)-triene-9,17-dione monooxygenase